MFEDPEVLEYRELYPLAVLKYPVVFANMDLYPLAVFAYPMVLEYIDFDPMAVLHVEWSVAEAPVPLLNNAESPTATRLARVVLLYSDLVPTAVLE